MSNATAAERRRGVSRASLWRRTITTDGGERGHRFTEGSLRKKSFYYTIGLTFKWLIGLKRNEEILLVALKSKKLALK